MSKQAVPPSAPSQLILPEQVAKRLLVSLSTLAKWRSAGVGPGYVKVGGGRVAYEEAEIERHIARRRVTTRDSRAA